MTPFPAIILSLFICALSLYSTTGFPVDDLLEQQRHENMELRELLVSTESRIEALQQKNVILKDLVIKMEIEALRQFERASTTPRPRFDSSTTVRLLGDVVPMSLPAVKHD
ncbi:uncharacterized protein LOC124191541 [Daphnia pulex]|uniref:uncharacterized protein LOC124191541 n=1 Tax=Daphnia pulex TaxID=6669 RepID=UPI001EDDC1E4|nr:uncharacterized protein LOC124191541 [Daphnia pulex]